MNKLSNERPGGEKSQAYIEQMVGQERRITGGQEIHIADVRSRFLHDWGDFIIQRSPLREKYRSGVNGALLPNQRDTRSRGVAPWTSLSPRINSLLIATVDRACAATNDFANQRRARALCRPSGIRIFSRTVISPIRSVFLVRELCNFREPIRIFPSSLLVTNITVTISHLMAVVNSH